MSSASAADCTHCRANRSNPGATSEKQFLQFSWLAIGSMTFSRSLLSRRRQVKILSNSKRFSVAASLREAQLAMRQSQWVAHCATATKDLKLHANSSESLAELNLRAKLDGRRPSDKLEAILLKNLRANCCK